MLSKFIIWLKNPTHYKWIKHPLHFSIIAVIISVIGLSAYYANRGYKADEIDDPSNTMPQITTFGAPVVSDGRDYIITVEVNNVANLIDNIGGWSFKQKAACVLYSGTAAYPITATSNNGTAIPRTQIHRADFFTSWGQKIDMEYAKETITLNCLNHKKADYQALTVRSSEKPFAPKVTLTAPIMTDPNIAVEYRWNSTYEDEQENQLCGGDINQAMDDEFSLREGSIHTSVVEHSEFATLFCRNKNEGVINFTTGQAIFLKPPQSQWRLEFTTPKEVRSNTNFEVQYAVYDQSGKKQKVGTYCIKSDGWSGETPDGAGAAIIPGWTNGSKKFTLTCISLNGNVITPVSRRVVVINRNLKFSVDNQDVTNYSDYQPPYNSPVTLSWEYMGSAADKCTASSINASTGKANSLFNGPVAFSGKVNVGSARQSIRYTLTCATEGKTINVLPTQEPITAPVQPPPTPQLNFTLNPTDYSAISSTKVYQLKNNKFTVNWSLAPANAGNPCTGTGEIAAWNTIHPSSGTQLLTGISGTKTLTLTCSNITRRLTVNYTSPAPLLTFTYTSYDRKIVTTNDTLTWAQATGTLNKLHTFAWNYTGDISTQCKMKFTDTAHPTGETITVSRSGTLPQYMIYSTETRSITCGAATRTLKITTGSSSGWHLF